MIVCLNGRFVPERKAKISAMSPGFLSGYGVYETLRTRNGVATDLDRHYDRLKAGAELFFGEMYWDFEDIERWIGRLVQKNRLSEARVRVTIATGELGEMILITATPIVEEPEEVYTQGVATVTYEGERPLPEIKTTNLAVQFFARRHMEEQEAYEVLLIDRDGKVREGSVTNVFMVRGGVLVTPGERVLRGIMRGRVIEKARDLKLSVTEREISLKELLKADEVFLTNSVKGIVPVVSIDGKAVGGGVVGRVTWKLRWAILGGREHSS